MRRVANLQDGISGPCADENHGVDVPAEDDYGGDCLHNPGGEVVALGPDVGVFACGHDVLRIDS